MSELQIPTSGMSSQPCVLAKGSISALAVLHQPLPSDSAANMASASALALFPVFAAHLRPCACRVGKGMHKTWGMDPGGSSAWLPPFPRAVCVPALVSLLYVWSLAWRLDLRQILAGQQPAMGSSRSCHLQIPPDLSSWLLDSTSGYLSRVNWIQAPEVAVEEHEAAWVVAPEGLLRVSAAADTDHELAADFDMCQAVRPALDCCSSIACGTLMVHVLLQLLHGHNDAILDDTVGSQLLSVPCAAKHYHKYTESCMVS